MRILIALSLVMLTNICVSKEICSVEKQNIPYDVKSIINIKCYDGFEVIEPAPPFVWGKYNHDKVIISAKDIAGDNIKQTGIIRFVNIRAEKLTGDELNEIKKDGDVFMKWVYGKMSYTNLNSYKWGYKITAGINTNPDSKLILYLAYERKPDGKPQGGRGKGDYSNPQWTKIFPFGIGYPFNLMFPAK